MEKIGLQINIKSRLIVLRNIVQGINVPDGDVPLSKDVVFFMHDVHNGLTLENKKYSPLFDPIREVLVNRNVSYVSFAYPWSVLSGSMTHSNLITFNRRFTLALIKYKFIQSITKRDYLKDVYSHILSVTNAKIVITTGVPSELCRAADDKEIIVLELLHAFGYHKPEWGFDFRNKDELPSYVCTFDVTSTKTFSRIPNLKGRVVQFKHPFLSRYTDKPITRTLPGEWRWRSPPSNNKKNILILLQWGYGGEIDYLRGILSNTIYPVELENAIEKSYDSVHWHIRLHPVFIRVKAYASVVDDIENKMKRYSNVTISQSTDLPLPEVLRYMDGCLSMSSMAVYEAAILGVPSLLLCPTLLQGGYQEADFADLVEAGYAQKKEPTVRNIINWINDVPKIKPYGTDNMVYEELDVFISDLMK